MVLSSREWLESVERRIIPPCQRIVKLGHVNSLACAWQNERGSKTKKPAQGRLFCCHGETLYCSDRIHSTSVLMSASDTLFGGIGIVAPHAAAAAFHLGDQLGFGAGVALVLLGDFLVGRATSFLSSA